MKMKKWLSLLLALVFCLGLAPMAAIPALAADAGTAGSLPDVVAVTINKVWVDADNQEGKRPDSVTVTLLRKDDPSFSETITLSEGGKWTYYKSGVLAEEAAQYYVKEEVLQGYLCHTDKTVDDKSGEITFTITNTLQREIGIAKVWDDNGNQDGLRPNEVQIQVQGSDKSIYDVPLSPRNTAAGTNQADPNVWIDTVSVPKYDSSGNEIRYTVQEPNVPAGYQSVARDVSANGELAFTITNTHAPEKTDIIITKVWEDDNDRAGKRPESVDILVMANDEKCAGLTLPAANNRQGAGQNGDPTRTNGGAAGAAQDASPNIWTATISLPKNEQGKPIEYTVQETDVPKGYKAQVTGDAESGFTITNTLQREITVTKVWEDEDDADGLRPRSVTVQLFANDEACGNPVTLQAAGQNDANGTTKAANSRDWTYTWQVPVYLNGRAIEYTVQETDVPKGYTAQVTGDAESGFTITNTHEPDTAEITVTKVWEDENDADELRPESIQVNLTLGGNTWSQELSEGNKWTCSWEVPARDADVYTVAEDTVPTGYTAEVTGDAESGFTITNTHVPTGIGGGEDDPLPAPALPEELPDMEDFVPFLPPAGHAPSGPSEPAEPSDPPALNKEDHFAYIIGTADGYVLPEANITRAEVATIFFRLLTDESRAQIWSRENSFPDVSPEDWYNNAVSTMASGGILKGYEDGTFRPMASITRAEFATIAIRFFRDEMAAEEQFSDVEGHWGEAYINMAAEKGLIKGYPDSSFRPDEPITRAEAITIINRLLERHPHKDKLLDGMIVWPDNADDSAWYYAEVQEATNSHAYEMEDGVERWTELLPIRDWAAFEKEWSTAFSAGNPGDVVSEDVEIDLDELGPDDDGEEAPEEAEPDNGEEPEDDQDEEDQDNQDNQDYGNNGGNG